MVTSLAEVWIEILKRSTDRRWSLSLPLRKCGLKSYIREHISVEVPSLPLRKCGLKSVETGRKDEESHVTSLAEVWIEIDPGESVAGIILSLPLRKCGLK